MKREDKHSIEVTEELVVIRRNGISQPILANILGMERNEDGSPKRVYLDRLVHSPEENTLGGWGVTGAISTILEAR
jgi:hypothetical protein